LSRFFFVISVVYYKIKHYYQFISIMLQIMYFIIYFIIFIFVGYKKYLITCSYDYVILELHNY